MQHILRPIDLRFSEPQGVGGGAGRWIDHMGAFVPDDIGFVPDSIPEVVNILCRPVEEVLIRVEVQVVFGVDYFCEMMSFSRLWIGWSIERGYSHVN